MTAETTSTSGLRVLGRIRLSKEESETGTSVDRQREAIEQWSAMHGHRVVGWGYRLRDIRRCRSVRTPELGPWLRQPQLNEWDALVAYRLDRLSRRVIPLNKLFGHVLEHGKTLASASESIDLSTWIGRLVANVIAGVAEGELEAISARNAGSHSDLRKVGRWHGGTPPYGYTTIRKADGWYLAPDPEERRVLREVVLPRVLAHASTNSIAATLAAAGVPTKNGGTWQGHTLRLILRSKTLLGQHEHNGRLVVDEETGLPLQRSEAVYTADEFVRVQQALKSKTVPVRAGREVNPLSGILFCHSCDAPMYIQKMKDRSYDYYVCSGRCGARKIRSDLAVELVEERLLFKIGDLPRREHVYTSGNDHADSLAAVTAAIEATRQEKDMGLYDGDDEGYFGRLERLTARRRELEALSGSEPGLTWRTLGDACVNHDVVTPEYPDCRPDTFGQAWQRMDPVERRTLLLDSGIRVSVSAGVGNQLFTHAHIPADLLERVER
jgi:site-specific DNA recombinase